MVNVLRQSQQWLAGEVRDHASSPVVYRRGDQTVGVAAADGKTEFELTSADGATVQYRSRDWLVCQDDLRLAGDRITPARGDKIEETVSGGIWVYEVMAPGDSPVCQSICDDTMWRIHTKRVS